MPSLRVVMLRQSYVEQLKQLKLNSQLICKHEI
jgi:hypothetical protein